MYEAFRRETGWDSSGELTRVRNMLWDLLELCDNNARWPAELPSDAMHLVPHADDFDSCLITAAQNCSICVDVALSYFNDRQPSTLGIVSEYTIDALISVELCKEAGYLSAGDDRRLLELELQIRRGDLVTSELAIQQRDLDSLVNQENLTANLVRNIRDRRRESRN
jgi:hypothetical protein